jgi:glucose-6-phosphate 1-dehydrogenase
MAMNDQSVSIIVLGASGDLARKKIYPALFALYCQKLLPPEFQILGYARTEMDSGAFRLKITENLTCRYSPEAECGQRMSEFLERCSYVSGGYQSAEGFAQLARELERLEDHNPRNRVFYLAIPPFLFLEVARSLQEAGLVHPSEGHPWARAVIEKPFGSDRESSDTLVREMGKVFSEEQTYRIDHYLGKEVIQNLLVLRFANLIFDPIWNRNTISQVKISWMEDQGTEGRAGYFDEYGIIRDVMQNHLLQILALIAMEQPVSLQARDVRDEKVKVLRSIPPLELEDLVLGQYTSGTAGGRTHPGYLEESGVPADSTTPTFASALISIRNRRWDGVPFLVTAGKGLDRKLTEIRIRFKKVPGNIFCETAPCLEPNELVIRVQPDEAISLEIMNKVPGLEIAIKDSPLDLRYHSTFPANIPDAYECLLLDVLKGNQSLFIRSDELATAWDIFTPVLHRIDNERTRPLPYPFGTTGPEGFSEFRRECGVE